MERALRRWAGIVIAAALLALSVTACGSDSHSDTSADTLTKSALVERADSICKQVFKERTKELYAYIRKHPKSVNGRKGQEAMVIASFIPPAEAGVRKLEALTPPEEGEEAYQEFVDGLRDAIAEAQAAPVSLLVGITGRDRNPFNGAKEAAARYGLQGCSTSF